jgi:DNA-binding NarL/FixJ family response regulator
LRRILGKSLPAWLRRVERRPAEKISHLGLSRRKQQTLELLVAGASEKEAAARMGLSVHTVHEYVQHIYRTLGVTSRAELVRLVLQSRAGGSRR